MLSEIPLDGGCVPSPEEPRVEEEKEEDKCARLERELAEARRANQEWCMAASSLVNVLLMSPRQNDAYATEVKKSLETAFASLSFELKYVDCSFPSTPANAPKVSLVKWYSLDRSEWHLTWAPAWSCEVCVDGRLSSTTLLRVSGVKIDGRLRLAFSSDLTRLGLTFADMPTAHVDVGCKVIIGQLPLPIQETMGGLVRDVALRWIRDHLVAPNQIDLTLAEKKKFSEQDFATAQRAALIGAARARDSASSWSLSRSISR